MANLPALQKLHLAIPEDTIKWPITKSALFKFVHNFLSGAGPGTRRKKFEVIEFREQKPFEEETGYHGMRAQEWRTSATCDNAFAGVKASLIKLSIIEPKMIKIY